MGIIEIENQILRGRLREIKDAFDEMLIEAHEETLCVVIPVSKFNDLKEVIRGE